MGFLELRLCKPLVVGSIPTAGTKLKNGGSARGRFCWRCHSAHGGDIASLIAPASIATSTTNYSDQWWNAAESGWGASALQQGDTIFFDIFVYGAQSQRTWFIGVAVYQATTAQGHQIFSGDLNATTGPYYRAGSFNPNAVTRTRVGTLTFEADSVDTATLTYRVSGVTVTKSVRRQSWKTENIASSYYGGLIYNASG